MLFVVVRIAVLLVAVMLAAVTCLVAVAVLALVLVAVVCIVVGLVVRIRLVNNPASQLFEYRLDGLVFCEAAGRLDSLIGYRSTAG
jgi:hypothetical protein